MCQVLINLIQVVDYQFNVNESIMYIKLGVCKWTLIKQSSVLVGRNIVVRGSQGHHPVFPIRMLIDYSLIQGLWHCYKA